MLSLFRFPCGFPPLVPWVLLFLIKLLDQGRGMARELISPDLVQTIGPWTDVRDADRTSPKSMDWT